MSKIGIKDLGAYLPLHRIERRRWIDAWGNEQMAAAMLGERTVAGFDEDPITMAAEAAIAALGPRYPRAVGALYLASTSAPYAEKQGAAILARVLDLPEESRTLDIGGSLRGGTSALIQAAEAMGGGQSGDAIVAAADMRLSEPRYYMETMMGDAAAAVLLGRENLVAEIEGWVSLSTEFTDVWRNQGDRYVRYDDEKYAATHGYLHYVPRAITRLLERQGLTLDDIDQVVAYAPEGPSYMALARRGGFGAKLNQDPLLMQVGNAGTASPLLQLAHVLASARPGQRIVLAGYGDGADAILLRTTDNVGYLGGKRTVADLLASRRPLESWSRLLHWREALAEVPLFASHPFTSVAMLRNQAASILPFKGHRCGACGAVTFPQARVCPVCHAKDRGEPRRLRKRGEVVTFTVDHVYPSPEPPTAMVAVDLEGGGRLLTQMTEVDPDAVRLGMPVELTLRLFHRAKGINHYFWKARPPRA